MKLSLKVEYACQVLAQLGHTFGRPELPHIEDLAKAEGIPSNYLVQILNELRNAGLIVSRRGKQGGYALSRAPKEITLLDIVRGVEGEMLEFSGAGGGQSSAATSAVWREMANLLEEKARGFTVEDLMGRTGGSMWYI